MPILDVFQEWPEDAYDLPIDKVIELYKGKFRGCYYDPEAREQLREEIIAAGGIVNGADATMAYGYSGSHAGKLVVPYVYVAEQLPGCWPGAAQARGDCYKAGTKVRMADGSERPIEQVSVGEYVISHEGRPQRVTRTIEKPYKGKLTTIKVDGYAHPVTATPDHLFITYPELWNENFDSRKRWQNRSENREWKAIGKLSIGDYLCLPRIICGEASSEIDLASLPGVFVDGGPSGRCVVPPPGKVSSRFSTVYPNRFVNFDERLGWLVGLYLAEGSMDKGEDGDGKRITFNLHRDEVLLAEQVKQYIHDIFGIEATECLMKSKPNVRLVRVGCSPVAKLFSSLVKGNTYSKEIPWQIFSAKRSVRLAMLRGWMDGDGHIDLNKRTNSNYFRCKLTGVSVSHELCRGMFDLANSCGLRPTLTRRKARGRSKPASDLHLYGEQALAVYPDRRVDCKSLRLASQHHTITEVGIAAKVKEIAEEDFEGMVYCLDVAEDHSFIAEGYASHNCVSHNEKNACLLTYGCEVYAAQPDEVTNKLEVMPPISAAAIKQGAFSTEVFYWYRGHGGDGWSCAASARVSMKNAGLVVRQDYPTLGFDLTKYSGSLAGKWGRSKPPEEVGRELALHLIRTVTEVDNPNTCRDLLGEGYGIGTCGGEGWSDERDQHGWSRRSGSWSHALAFLAFDDRPETVKINGTPWVLIQNSWGRFNSGPRDIRDSAQYVPAAKKQDWIAKGLVNPNTGNLLIPEGSYWANWSDVKNRDMYAHSGTNGWPARNLNPFHVPGVFT